MQRFTDTIKYGIFFYGFAPDEEQNAAENLEQHVIVLNTQMQKNLTKVVSLVLHFQVSPRIKYLLMFRSVWLVCIAISHIAVGKISQDGYPLSEHRNHRFLEQPIWYVSVTTDIRRNETQRKHQYRNRLDNSEIVSLVIVFTHADATTLCSRC